MLVIVVFVVWVAWQRNQYEKKIAALQNQVATQATTIEVQKGVFEKQAQDVTKLQNLIDTSTTQGKALSDQLSKTDSQVANLTNLVIQLKAQVAKGQGTVDHPPETPGESRVSFDQAFGLFKVSGFTLAPSGKYELHLDQALPLKIGVAVARDREGVWHSFATSSDETMKIDLGMTGVDTSLFAPSWYEKLKLQGDLGVGDGVLVGLGMTYKFGHFDVGPSLWGAGGKTFYGLGMAWAPFEKDR
jgi:hypothetical protein